MAGSAVPEVIPGVTTADVDKMADIIFGRVDENHPVSGSADIIKILDEGFELAFEHPVAIKNIHE
ncbi:hypothetical protein FACS1894137_16000 [Spirochaetia bacterium]|nr:hypothetical protein FACS1894137_16000 [Spirochaetia bacterium]